MTPAQAPFTPAELADPTIVFTELFDSIHLTALQESMWTGLKALVTGGYKHLTLREKEMQVEVYERLTKAVQAMHLMAEQRKDESASFA